MNVIALARVAIALATETAGAGDPDVIAALIGPLPDGGELALVAMWRAYQHQRAVHGAEALQRSGLALAQQEANR